MSKVTCGTMTDNKKIVILHLINAVVTIWQDEAVSLTVHGLRTQSTSDEEHISVTKLLHAFRQLEHSNLDSCILLRSNTFATASIVISTGLSFRLRKDRVAFAKLNLILGFKMVVLPPNESIEVWILRCRNKAASPIRAKTEIDQVFFSQRWEEVKPVVRIRELGNF
jgi:hypothetical protein